MSLSAEKPLEEELRDIEITLTQISLTYPDIARAAARSRYTYDMAKAQAMWDIDHRALADGEKKATLPIQDAEATLMIAKEKEAARLAENELDIAQKLMKNLESRLSSTQSRVKLSLIERGVTNYQT